MSTKAISKKANAAMQKAPPIVYVEICAQGEAQYVSENPEDAEDIRDSDNRIARYRFDGFVTVKVEAVVTDVAA